MQTKIIYVLQLLIKKNQTQKPTKTPTTELLESEISQSVIATNTPCIFLTFTVVADSGKIRI